MKKLAIVGGLVIVAAVVGTFFVVTWFGDTKTECSRRPVPLHPLILESLLDWKRQSLYQGDGDFLFPSSIRSKNQ